MHAVKCNNKLEIIWIQNDRLLLFLESEIEYKMKENNLLKAKSLYCYFSRMNLLQFLLRGG